MKSYRSFGCCPSRMPRGRGSAAAPARALAIALVLAGAAGAEEATAQTHALPAGGETLLAAAAPAAPMCPAGTESDWRRELELAQALEDVDARREALERLEGALRQTAGTQPHDPDAQFALAAVMGAGLEDRSGRARIARAGEVHAQVELVLALDPLHPGASHILGRLHAGVLRLDRITRFLATRVLGGGALGSASWERAQGLLERAEQGEPCVPEYHLELARLYADRGDPGAALRELGHVLESVQRTPERKARMEARVEEVRARLGAGR